MLKKGDDPFLQARPYECKTHPAPGSARGRRGEGAEPAAGNGFQGAPSNPRDGNRVPPPLLQEDLLLYVRLRLLTRTLSGSNVDGEQAGTLSGRPTCAAAERGGGRTDGPLPIKGNVTPP